MQSIKAAQAGLAAIYQGAGIPVKGGAFDSGRGYGSSAPGTLGTSKTTSPSSSDGIAGPQPTAKGTTNKTANNNG